MGDRDPSAPDWELLSMSMSASTFASPSPNPNPNPSSAKTGDNPTPISSFRYPVLDDPNPSPAYGSALDTSTWTKPFHDGASGDVADKTLGMPQQSVLSHLHVHNGGHGYGEEIFGLGYGEENLNHPDLDAESLLHADPFMAASQDLVIEAAEAGVSSTNMDADDQAPKKKVRRSRSAKVVWTIAVAATVVGIAMLRHRLRAELYQNQQLRLELSIKDEKLDDLTRQVSSLKEVLLSRHYTARNSAF